MDTSTATQEALSFERQIPPYLQAKRRGSRGSASRGSDGSADRKERKRQKPVDLMEKFKHLDPSNPNDLNRIEQRRKAISKGKNTVGYDAYRDKVKKEQRRLRSMETPSTPDPTLDISNKRWQGLVRAWRIALHKYDPPDLVNSFDESGAGASDILSGETMDCAADLPLVSPGADDILATPVANKKQLDRDTLSPKVLNDDQSPISVLSSSSPMEMKQHSPRYELWGDDSDIDDDIL